MKQVIWIYGASAAGKETFIKNVTKQAANELRQKLEWHNKKVAACPESIDWVGKYIGDPIVNNREKLITKIPDLIKHVDVLLIKGQDIDLVADRPNKLLAKLPNYKHRVIYISTSIDELMKRLPRKPAWNSTDTKKDTLSWISYQIEMLDKLDEKIEIISIDGSSNGSYSSLPLPNALQNRLVF